MYSFSDTVIDLKVGCTVLMTECHLRVSSSYCLAISYFLYFFFTCNLKKFFIIFLISHC